MPDSSQCQVCGAKPYDDQRQFPDGFLGLLCGSCLGVIDDLFAELAEKHANDGPSQTAGEKSGLACLFCERETGPRVQDLSAGAAICADCFAAGKSGHARRPTDARLAQIDQRALDARREQALRDAPLVEEAWHRAKERVKRSGNPRFGDVEIALVEELRRLTGESEEE